MARTLKRARKHVEPLRYFVQALEITFEKGEKVVPGYYFFPKKARSKYRILLFPTCEGSTTFLELWGGGQDTGIYGKSFRGQHKSKNHTPQDTTPATVSAPLSMNVNGPGHT